MRPFLPVFLTIVTFIGFLHFTPAVSAEAEGPVRQRADQGDADAQEKLGEMYENGSGVVQSNDAAVEWYSKAASQGNAAARARLVHLRYQIAMDAEKKQADAEEQVAQNKKAQEEKANTELENGLPKCDSDEGKKAVKEAYENGPDSKLLNVVFYDVDDAQDEGAFAVGDGHVRRNCIGIADTNAGKKYIAYTFESRKKSPEQYFASIKELDASEYGYHQQLVREMLQGKNK